MQIPKFSPAERICNTSIEDGRSSVAFINDPVIIKAALEHELKHKQRATMVNILESKLKQLEKIKVKTKS